VTVMSRTLTWSRWPNVIMASSQPWMQTRPSILGSFSCPIYSRRNASTGSALQPCAGQMPKNKPMPTLTRAGNHGPWNG
jgi:hypothetical protein